MAVPLDEGAADAVWAPGTTVGSYRVLRRIAVGGMAEVYEAEHARLGARVALKRLLPGFAGRRDLSQRLLREARAAATLLHPNIVRVHDIEADAEATYLVMELIEGHDLRRHLDARPPLSAEATAALLGPVFEAIAYAHARGVVHRDLKPANIIVGAAHDGSVRPMVADFGLAHGAGFFADSLVTEDEQLLGTPAYFAPELCEGGGRPSAASDQYALGVIAYEALTGRRPHQGANLAALVRNILDAAVTPPRELQPEVPADVSDAVLRALSRAPADRFASVADFAAAMGMTLTSVASEGSRRSVGSTPSGDGRDVSLAPVSVAPRAVPRRVARGAWAALGATALLVGYAAWRVNAAARVRPVAVSSPRHDAPSPAAPAPASPPAAPVAPSPAAPAPASVTADAAVPHTRVSRRRVIERRAPTAPSTTDAGAGPRCIGPNGINLCL